MTKDEALKMCLEYIETDKHERKYVRHAIKAALEQQAEPVKPAGQLQECLYGRGQVLWFAKLADLSMLYTAPPQRPWVGLTEEEMSDIVADMDVDFGDLLWKVVCLTKIIEARLKEKNNV